MPLEPLFLFFFYAFYIHLKNYLGCLKVSTYFHIHSHGVFQLFIHLLLLFQTTKLEIVFSYYRSFEHQLLLVYIISPLSKFN